MKKTVWLLFLALLASGALPARADIGPKPVMRFDVATESGLRPDWEHAKLLVCTQWDCRDALPLKRLGPQGFTCNATSCYALAYGFPPFAQIEIPLFDGPTLRSNVFDKKDFVAHYTLSLSSTSLKVENKQ